MAVIDLTDSNMGTVDKNVYSISRLVNIQVKNWNLTRVRKLAHLKFQTGDLLS
jgi:hypothetical protein